MSQVESNPAAGAAAPEPRAEEVLHKELLSELQQRGVLRGAAVDRSGEAFPSLEVTAADLPGVVSYLKSAGHVNFLDSITAIDRLQLDATVPENASSGRFCLLYQLMSLPSGRAVNLRVVLPADSPTIPTIDEIFGNGNWLEREVFDLFGVTFTGSKDLRRILLPPEWEGSPMRRDYVEKDTALGFPTTRPDSLGDIKEKFSQLMAEGAE